MSRRHPIRPAVAIAGVALACLGLALILAVLSAHSQAAAAGDALSPTASTHLAVFDSAPQYVGPVANPGFVLDATATRLAQQQPTAQAYVTGGPAFVCVGARLPGKANAVACSTIDGTVSGAQPPTVMLPVDPSGVGQWVVATLVPDGAKSVRFSDGTVAPVINNTALVTLNAKPTGLTYTTGDGVTHTIGQNS